MLMSQLNVFPIGSVPLISYSNVLVVADVVSPM